MAVEQMCLVDRRENGGGMVLQLKSPEPVRHKQFDDECRRAMHNYNLLVWSTGVGDYSIVNLITDSRDVAVNASCDIASRMALGLVFE